MASVAGSRSESLLEVVFGYTLASSIISSFVAAKPEQILYLSAVIGGFLSAFLYYLKPLDYLIRRRLSGEAKSHYWSPYVRPLRTSITAGMYLSVTALIAVIFPATSQFIVADLRLYVWIVIAFLSLSVLAVVIARWIWLQGRALLTSNYYLLLSESRYTEGRNPVGILERALRDEDWEQAAILLGNLGVELPPPDKWERRLNSLLDRLYRKTK